MIYDGAAIEALERNLLGALHLKPSKSRNIMWKHFFINIY